MAASCVGNKPSTAVRKARDLFNKYEPLIEYSIHNREYDKKEIRRLNDLVKTYKSGVIKYSNETMKGTLRIKDIEQVDVREKDVLIVMRSGREVVVGSDFAYLRDLL